MGILNLGEESSGRNAEAVVMNNLKLREREEGVVH
jgi:hypothetical protein